MSSAGKCAIVAGIFMACMTSAVAQVSARSGDATRVGGVPVRSTPLRFTLEKPRIVVGERFFSGVGTLVDLDLDGFQDVAFGGTFFLETGGTFSYIAMDEHMKKKAEIRFLSPSKNPTHVFPLVVSADLNEDHLPDLIGVGRHGGLSIHLRALIPGEGARQKLGLGFRSHHFIPAESDIRRVGALAFEPTVLRVVDLDGDGHQDFLLAGDYIGLGGIMDGTGLLFLRGDGKGGLARPKLLQSGRVYSVEWTDLNADGRRDLAVLGDDGQVALLFRKRLGGYLTHTVSLTAISDAKALMVRDLDQDGITDYVLLRECPESDCVKVAVYKGLRGGMPGAATKFRIFLSRREKVMSCLMQDFDGDGSPDLAILCVDPKGRMVLELYSGAGKRAWSERETHFLGTLLASELSSSGTGYMKFEDVDGDGAPDFWISPVRITEKGKLGFLYLKSTRAVKAPIRRLGTATATGRGAFPRISTAGGLPRIGNKKFALRLTNVPGDRSLSWLWISHVRMDVHILGMRVKVFPFRTVVTRSEGTGERGGIVRIPFRIPVDRNLVGERLFFQWVFPSRGAKNPLSLARSEALQVTFLSDQKRPSLPHLR